MSTTFEVTAYRTLWFGLQYDSETVEQGEMVGNGALTTVRWYDGEPERTIDAAQPADLLKPTNMEHLDQPLFLLGHGIENPADGIHGDEEYLYAVELPTQNPFDEPGEWRVRVEPATQEPTKS